MAHREAARRWEHNQRLFQDLSPKAGKGVSQVSHNVEWFWLGDDGEAGLVDAVGSQGKCSKCGSRKHETSSCTVDLTKIKCFRCGQHGHVGLNCSQFPGSSNKTKRGTGDGKGYLGNSPGKSKGTGKGKYGKKGKMNELVYENDTTDNDNDWWTQSDTDAWWHAWSSHDWDEPDPDAWWADESPTQGTQANDMEEPGQAVGSLVLSPLLLACSTEPSCGDLSLSDAHVFPVTPASHDSLSVPWELQGLICTAPRRIRVAQCACWYEQFANQ